MSLQQNKQSKFVSNCLNATWWLPYHAWCAQCSACLRGPARAGCVPFVISATVCICFCLHLLGIVCYSNGACIASSYSFSSSLNLLPDGRSGRPPFSFSLSVRISTMTVLLSLATASRAAAGLISPAYPLNAPRAPLKTGGPYNMHAT